MKLTVDSAALKDAVVWAARYLPAKPDRPALAGLLLRADENGLTVVGADGDTWATAHVSAEIWDDGAAVLPGKLLADIAGKLPAAPAEITYDGTEATLVCGAFTSTVPTTGAVDYPIVPALPARLGDVGAGAFATAVTQIAVAAAKDNKLPAATGLYLETTEHGLRLSASDAYRLARTTVALTPDADRGPGGAALIPAATMNELARTAAGKVALHLEADGARSLGLAWEGRQVTTPLLDVRPIAYDRALRLHAASGHVDVDRAALLDSLGRIGVVFDGKTMPRLHLALADGELALQVRGGSSPRGRASETLPVAYDGEPREMQVNAHNLTEAVKSARGETLRIELTATNSVLLRSEIDPNWVHLVILLKNPAPEVAG